LQAPAPQPAAAPSPLEQSAAAWGLVVAPVPPPPALELWAENVAVVALFNQLQSQWRTGMSGATGLDYAALPPRYRPGHGGRMGARRFEQLQVMEQAALQWAAEQRERARVKTALGAQG
jgi:hypothetical protein